MRKLFTASLRFKTAILSITLVFLIFGFITIPLSPKSQNPKIEYFGLVVDVDIDNPSSLRTLDEIATDVSSVVEKDLLDIAQVTSIQSYTYLHNVKFLLELEYDSDLETATTLVNNKLSKLSLPTYASNLNVTSHLLETPSLILTLQSNTDIVEAYNQANLLKDEVKEIEDVTNIVVSGYDASNPYDKHLLDGERVISIGIYLNHEKNIVSITKNIEEVVDKYKTDDITIEIPVSEKEEIDSTFVDFFKNLITGLGVVVAVVFLFLGFKNAIIVSVTIPLTISLSFLTLYFIGEPINSITIAAFIISLGILVDNAIVLNDSIKHNLDTSQADTRNGIRECIISAINDIFYPVLSSTITTILAFVPLFFLGEEARQLAYHIPLVVIINVIFSFIVSFLILPSLSSFFLKASKRQTLTRRIFKPALMTSMFRNIYKAKRFIIFISLVFIIGAAYFITLRPIKLFPAVDRNVVYINYYLDDYENISDSEQVYNDIMTELSNDRRVTSVYASQDGELPKFYDTVYNFSSRPISGQVYVEVEIPEASIREQFAENLQKTLNTKVSRATIRVQTLEFKYQDDDISVTITADKDECWDDSLTDTQNELNCTNEIKAASDMLTNYLITLDGIDTNEVFDSMKSQVDAAVNYIRIHHNGEVANIIGANVLANADIQDVQKQVEDFINLSGFDLSNDVNVFYEGEKASINEYMMPLLISGGIALVLLYIVLFATFRKNIVVLLVLFAIPLSMIGTVFLVTILDLPITFTLLLGSTTLIGIVINDAILLLDNILSKQSGSLIDRAAQGASRKLRPIILTSLTTIFGFLPLLFSDSELFAPMAVGLIGGLTLSTLLTLIVIPSVLCSIYSEE